MINMIKSEHLKQKHSFQKILIWLAPSITLLLAYALMGSNYILSGGYNWWYILILPGSITIISCFVINSDSSRKFHGLFSVVVDKQKLWYGKIILCSIYLGMTCLVFFVEVTIVGYLFSSGMPLKNSFLASIILFITYLWQIPLFMYVSMKFKTVVAVIISMVCNFGIGIFFSLGSAWIIPFAIPSRLMCHVIEVLPNGLPVENGDYVFNIKIIITGLLISSILYILTSYISARLFKEQEI